MKPVLIFISAAVINNFVLTYFLGICPFIGTSRKVDTAFSMGLATSFVLVLTAALSWLIHNLIIAPYGLHFMRYVAFILAIAALVQLVEMFIRKTSPPLYRALGIFLPLITTNCIVLGLALFEVQKGYRFIESVFYGLGAGVGFTIAMVIMASFREELEFADVPPALQGAPMVLILAGLLALAFMGFTGMLSV